VDINLATGMTSAHLPSGSNAMAEIEKPIQQLGEEIEAGERRAFAAGWDAWVDAFKVFLRKDGITDFRAGFEDAWVKYWESREG
jgi:hypothetical protein